MRPSGVNAARLLVAVVLSTPAAALAEGALTRAGEVPRLQARSGDKLLPLPLEHTDVRAEIAGFLARVEVRQTYGNPSEAPIEAIYVFPLPDNAAVDGFRMAVGARVIEGVVQKREEARRTYEAAKKQGQTAALLEQERPNVFTQSVANLAPHERIEVVTRYVQTLAYDAGRYELAFPMVVGPLYRPANGGGSPVKQLFLPENSRSGHDVSLQVAIEGGVGLRELESPSHEVEVQRPPADEGRILVRLADRDAVPNRDFVLRWTVAAPQPQAALLTHHDGRSGYFSLVVQPPQLDVEKLVGQRELVFVVDVSGSMSGLPLWLCQQAMREALARLRPGDTFNVLSFAGATGKAFPGPRRATQENVADALAFVVGLRAGGGTEMLDAVEAALAPEVEPGRRRYVFFLTDGFVDNVEQIGAASATYVRALEQKGQRGRVFGLGIGSSPNRDLIETIGRKGKGAALYASNREDPVKAVVRFFRVIDHPVLEDVSIDWGGLPVRDLAPAATPDLLLSRPLIVHGAYAGAARGRIVVRGYDERGKVEIPIEVALAGAAHGNPGIASLWARAQVREAMDGFAYARFTGATVDEAATKEKVAGLGIAHHLMTPYTSFVAVDTSRVVGNGKPTTVQQPAEVPEDVDPVSSGAAAMMGAVGTAGGFGGLGLMGAGRGGGGMGATLGLGGAASGIPGGSYGSSFGAGAGHLGAKGSVTPAGKVVVQGSVDKEQIRKVFHRSSAQTRYCYELALQANPKLAGRLVVKLEIDANGDVKSVKVVGGDLRDTTLEGCLLARIRTWKFPKPAGAGALFVTYPFVFRTAN